MHCTRGIDVFTNTNAYVAFTGVGPLVSATISQQEGLASFDAIHLLAVSVSAKTSLMAIDAVFGSVYASWSLIKSSSTAAVMTAADFLLSTDCGGKKLAGTHCCSSIAVNLFVLYHFCAVDENCSAIPGRLLCVIQHTTSCLIPLWLQLPFAALLSVTAHVCESQGSHRVW